MGAIESTEAGSFWDNTLELARNTAQGSTEDIYYPEYEDSYYRDEYARQSQGELQQEEEEELQAAEGVGGASAVAAGIAAAASAAAVAAAAAEERSTQGDAERAGKNGEEISTAASLDPVVEEEERQGEGSELSISKNQKTHQVAPEGTTKDGSTTEVVRLSRARRPSTYRDAPFAVLFVAHMLLVAAGIVYLNIVYLKGWTGRKLHNLERWFPQLGAAIVVGSLFAGVCQMLFRLFPFFMARSIVWISSFLTLAAALMLVSSSSAAGLGVGILCLIFSVCQSLYACWVSSRITYAGLLLFHALDTARKAPGVYFVSYWILLIASSWVAFWSFGLVSALTFRMAPLVVLALLATMAWTLETLRNVVYAVSASNVASVYHSSSSKKPVSRSLFAAFTSWFGSICLGSLIVPILHTLRVVARGVNRIHGDHEFMFSCADCFVGVMDTLARHANNWAYAQVAIRNKSFVRASEDAYDLFKSTQLHVVIDTDLTSAFCVLSGVSGGMLCALVSGGWEFGTHKPLTSSISVVAFFVGYFLVRITMAVPQGSVAAHYLCYAESPSSEGPVSERLAELLPDVADPEIGKKA